MKRILVAEDNPTNRELIREILESHGYEVVEASDGKDALEKAESAKPNLILLDISMPKLDGYSVLYRLRENPRTAGLPVIALTAYAMRSDWEKGLAAGFNAYITKPITARLLLSEIETFLK